MSSFAKTLVLLVGVATTALLPFTSVLAQGVDNSRQATQAVSHENNQPQQQHKASTAAPIAISSVWSSTLLANPTSCARGVLLRKEIRDLSAAEWNAYVAAVKSLQASSVYDRLVKIHIDMQATIHNYPIFLPWHRYYVRQFELHLQRVDPSVTVPYWNWAIDAQAPETSDVLSAKYFGGNGQGAKNCVMDGAFADWQPYYPRGRHCMRREFDLTNAISAWYGPEPINSAITSSLAYDAFRRSIEYPIHGAIHTNIGSDFSSMASPNDPLFFSHHAYVDKLWVDWQKAQSRVAMTYNGVNANGSRAQSRDQVFPWKVTVAQVLDTQTLCYAYAETQTTNLAAPRAVTPAAAAPEAPTSNDGWMFLVRRSFHEESPVAPRPNASPSHSGHNGAFSPVPSSYEEPMDAPKPAPCRTGQADYTADIPDYSSSSPFTTHADPYAPSYADRQNLLAVRIPRPLPDWWATMNKVDLTELRSREKEFANVCRSVNMIPTYVSPTALYHHPRALEKIAPKVKTFYAVVNGTKVVPAQGGLAYRTDSSRAAPHSSELVADLRRSIFEQCKEKLAAPVASFSGYLERAIGPIVHPILSHAYPTLAQSQDSYDEDEYCDADYGDEATTSIPPPTYTPNGVHPNHAIRSPAPVQSGAYNKRDTAPKSELLDGGDYYDVAPLD